MKRIKSPRQQQGLSLVELMVAITLSLVLTLGVIQIFSSSKQTNRVQGALGDIQGNARFGLDLLSYDLRMAGNLGCDNNVKVNNLAAAQLAAIGNGISGFEKSQLGATVYPLFTGQAIPSSANVINDTDVVVVRYAAANASPVDSATATSIILKTSISAKNGDPLIISDCTGADIFVANTGNNELKEVTTVDLAAGSLSKAYNENAEVTQLRYVAYYIRKDIQGNNNLYRSEVTGATGNPGIISSPLLLGVDDMELLYGEQLNGGNIRYVPADTAGINMNNVNSVRLNLLMSTVDENLTNGAQNYWLNGELTTVANSANSGKKLLRGFTTTVQLRN